MELSEFDSKLLDALIQAVENLDAERLSLAKTVSECRKVWTFCGHQLATSSKVTSELEIATRGTED
jgi:hypothetical protein